MSFNNNPDEIKEIFDNINQMRANPSSHNKGFEKILSVLGVMRGNEKYINGIRSYMEELDNTPSVHDLIYNDHLFAVANQQMEEFAQNHKIQYMKPTDRIIRKNADNLIEGYNTLYQIVDDDTQAPRDAIFRILFSKKDTDNIHRKALLDPKIKYVGISYREIRDRGALVVVLADKVRAVYKPEIATRQEVKVPEHLTELKEAFDSFDINKVGLINPRVTVNAIKALGYDRKNPALFKIMEELDTKENYETGVNFDRFVDHITNNVEDTSTKKGLKRIFDIFVDDPVNDSITAHTLRKICVELGEDVTNEEIAGIVKRASSSGSELTFDEFYDFMMKKNEMKNQQ